MVVVVSGDGEVLVVDEALMDKAGTALLKRGPVIGSRLLKEDGVGVMDGDINKVACIMAAAAAEGGQLMQEKCRGLESLV